MGSRISDWNKTGWGEIPMSLGFTYSSNTLMMHLQDLVGADKMKSWYEKIWLLVNQLVVYLMAKQKVISLGRMNATKTSAFGQSTTVTPVQMIQAQSAFLIKGICLNRGFVDSIKINFQKTFYQGEKNCWQTNYCFYRK